MKATLTDEQAALTGLARDLAGPGLQAARQALEADVPPGPLDARLFASFAGLGVPEEAGGAGGSLVELALVLSELGRQVAPGAYVPHVLAEQVALAAGLLEPARRSGEVYCLAADEAGRAGWGPWSTSVAQDSVRGQKDAVPCGPGAEVAVVVGGADGVGVARPVRSTPRTGVDPCRPAADLLFDGPAVAVAPGGAAAGLRRACVLLAAELCGVGRGAVERAVEYAKLREQFGQPIGRFQGVAHQLADAWVGLELAWSLTLFACWALDAGDPAGEWAAHDAKAKAGEAAVFACERALQVHGGMGMTWEADPHLYLRRALADDAWLGGHAWHRRRVGLALIEPST